MRLPPARATVALVLLPIAAWLLIAASGLQQLSFIAGGFIPARAAGLVDVRGAVPAWLTPLTATLLHANALHLGFNMLMMGFCGRYVEVALRSGGLLMLYVLGAYAAALAQFAVDPASPAPMIGASGAVSAVFGAYALLFGRQRAAVGDPALNRLINIAWLAAAWIGLQLLIGLAMPIAGGGIAIAAHVGGFLAGLLLARPLLLWRYRSA